MSSRQADTVLHGLTRLVEAQTATVPDGQLLRRFAAHRDEGAFAVLVHRHGPLVYGVCRNILRRQHDAEDAFQATFMVLARRAGAIREGQALGGWLYRVAYRVAMKARRSADLRRLREDKAGKPDEERPNTEIAWRELQAMLDEELNRLPTKYRVPFVLCCLTGKSKAEAAAELHWKEGTVSSRLARARELLQGRLARRGVTLSAVLSGLAISQNGTAIAVPAALVAVTQEQSLVFASGRTVTGAPAVLARSVLRGMTISRFAMVASFLVVVGLAGTTTVAILNRTYEPESPATPPGPAEVAIAQPVEPGGPPVAPVPVAKMTMSGSVLGPGAKKGFPGADIAVLVSNKSQPNQIYGPARYGWQLLGSGRADEEGQFELSVPQTTQKNRRLTVWTSAPGHSPFTRTADPQALTSSKHEFRGECAFELIRGQTVRGRLLDPEGRPAKKVPVLVLGMLHKYIMHIVDYEPPVYLPGWPKNIVTDDEGNFTIPNIGPDFKILLQVRDERYATTWLHIQTTNRENPKPVEFKLLPPRTLVGRVAAQDTGKPLADALVVVETMMPNPTPRYGAFPGYVTAHTDEKGEFRVHPFAGERLEAYVYPEQGGPYLAVRKYFKWPEGAREQQFDLPIPRGVQLRGKVEEKATRRPVGGAAVTYQWGYRNNPYRLATGERKDVEWRFRDTSTDADGKFTITVPPGPGQLLVKAADPDFVRVETSSKQAEGGKGGKPFFPDAFVPFELKPSDGPQDLSIQLRRGVTFRGGVVASDGSPVKSAMLFAPNYIPDGIEFNGRHVDVREGRFELPGCDADGKVALWVYDPQKKEGAHAEFHVGVGGDPIIRLAPCTSGGLRIVDKTGKRIPKAYLNFELVLRPGEDTNLSAGKGTPAAISVPPGSIYSAELYPADTGDGTYPLRDLIPGATYAVQAMTPSSTSERITFTAPKTGVLDLNSLVIQPRPKGKNVALAVVGQTYVYEVTLEDPDGDPAMVDLVQGPAGMRFDPQTFVLYWVPDATQVGDHMVILRASDSQGTTGMQKFPIHVEATPPPPPEREKP